MTIIWCMVPEILSIIDRIFCHFGPFFTLLTPVKTQKIKILKNWKNTSRDIIILYKCTETHDHMLYSSLDMACNGYDCYFSFCAIFCPFTPLTAQKIKIKKKMEKIPGDIIILHMCAKNYDKMTYGSWDMVCDGWTDRQTDRWKKWHTEVGAPPKNKYLLPPRNFIHADY